MKKVIEVSEYKSPVGELIIGSLEGEVCLCDWKYRRMRTSVDERIKKALQAEFVQHVAEENKRCTMQLEAYFSGELKEFDLKLKFAGSDFQQKVWNSLLQVHYGQTETYLGLSKILENPDAIRAVASANGANAISIIVPCHRIIGSNGELTGYAGGLPAKKKLLQLEGGYSIQTSLFED